MAKFILRAQGAAAAACLMAAASASAENMRVSNHWPLAGPVAWDYLATDASGAHLFVTRGTEIDVLDTGSGKLLATIPGMNGAHGVALAEDARRGYVSNGKSDTVTMFDLDSYKPIKEAPVSGHNPDAIVFDAVAGHVFTFNGRSSDVSVLSADGLAVVTTLKVPGKPEFAASDGQGKIFVNIETEPGQLVVIDARRLSVISVWQLPGCDSPSGLALDKANRRLFSVCDHKVMVVTDAQTGRQVSRIAIGDGPDAAAYDARRGLVFSSNGQGTLTIVHQDSPDAYRIVQTLATKKGARTMALNGATGDIYLSSAGFPATAPPAGTRPVATPDTFEVLEVSAR